MFLQQEELPYEELDVCESCGEDCGIGDCKCEDCGCNACMDNNCQDRNNEEEE